MLTALEHRRCKKLRQSTSALTDPDVHRFLSHVVGWKITYTEGCVSIHKRFMFQKYDSVFDFVRSIAAAATIENHHPKLVFEYSLVDVTWWTHSAKGLHENDFIMASKTDVAYNNLILDSQAI